MKRNMNFRKNYVVLGIIYAVVIVIVLYLASWYNTYKEYEKGIPVLQNVISEITPSEVDHYLTENPSPILYFCAASDSDCRSFEESIKASLEKKGYDDLTYVNLEEISDRNSYMNSLLEKYNGTDFTVERIPCLIKFTDGKITAVMDGINGNLLTKDEALNFIDVNEKTGQ